MKKTIQTGLRLLPFLAAFTVAAQDNTDFVQFFVNAASLNPSYVGIDAQPALYLGYRRQWAGIQGGPSLVQASLQAPLKKGLLGGLTVSDNSRGLLNTSSVFVTGGYQVPVSEDQFLRFGLSLGAAWNRLNTSQVQYADLTDPVLTSMAGNNFSVVGNAGISFHTKTFHGGLSIPQFFQPAYVSQNAFEINKVKPFQTVVLHVSNRFYYARNKNVFEPYLIYRISGVQPSQLELAAVVHLQNKVWAGASFKQGLGVSALGGIKLTKLSALGYSFTTRVSKENQLPRPSHEVHLALLFGKRDSKITGVYSFVNTEKERKKKTPAQLAAQREALAKKYQDKNVHHETPPVQKAPETKVEPQIEVVVVQPKDTVVVKEVPKPAVERHEFVKRGTNKNELPAGNYVIVGAFRSEVNAKRFTLDLHDMDITEADYGFISVRNLWYTYVATSKDFNESKVARDKYRHENMFKDAWLLTVQ